MIAGDVHVWVTALDGDDPDDERLRVILDQSELERAARFRSRESRQRFTVKHAIRRRLLAEYLGGAPEGIGFVTTLSGKPRIDAAERLDFSDAASGGIAVYAVALDMRLGIDVEQIRPVPDAQRIVERFGSAAEVAGYRQLPSADRDVAFLRWWTAKEAYVKALGSGLLGALDRFSVSFPSNDGTRRLEVLDTSDLATDLTLTEIAAAPGYVGTLITIGRPAGILQRRWKSQRPRVARGAA